MSDLESKYTIDNKIVDFEQKFEGISVYSREEEVSQSITLYFVDTGTNKCMKKVNVGAKCGQNQGYICSVEWSTDD